MKKWIILLFFMGFSCLSRADFYCDAGEPAARGVKLETMLGPILIALYDNHAPLTTQNFVNYVEAGFYNNTIIHYMRRHFMVAMGQYDTNLTPKKLLYPPIPNEASLTRPHTPLRVAMLRDAHPDTATSGFFINLAQNDTFNIPNGYAVFGEVIEGKDVIDNLQYRLICNDLHKPIDNCRWMTIKSAKLVTIPCASSAREQGFS